jgi:3-hydroxyisobutyrate dehydrogenase-like beta-hydroxyacid dehydrogenase
MARVGFIGLGVMGFPMAGHLARHGHSVTVYNRTKTKATDWITQYGGTSADEPADIASQSDFVFCCVGNDDDLRSVVLKDGGAFEKMTSGSTFIDHSTVSAKVTQELASVAGDRHFNYIDAPVSGGQLGAEKGILTVMCGGSHEPFARVKPLIDCYSKSCVLMGENGAGQITKMVNQICIAGVLQGLAEGLLFSEKAGLDTNLVLEVIAKGAAGSWQMENRGKTMVKNEFNFGFAVDWMRKDLGICLDEANAIGASLPITALIDQYYKDVQNIGGARWDTSSLIARLRKLK